MKKKNYIDGNDSEIKRNENIDQLLIDQQEHEKQLQLELIKRLRANRKLINKKETWPQKIVPEVIYILLL